MTQHDQVLNNATGSAFRTDLNNALAALFGGSSGTAQPTVRVAGQFWFDTSSTTVWTLWLRNGGNTAWIKLFEIDAATIVGMGLQAISGIREINEGPIANPFRNVVINGDFAIWQRNTTQTISGYGSVDRFLATNSTSTKTVSRQAHTLGQIEVPGNPKYFHRTVVATTGNSTGNYVATEHRIENAGTLGGKRVTLTFYAKADSPKNIAVEFLQSFGTGGTPSAIVYLPPQTCALTTAWKRFSLLFDIPSITGKVLGTSNNDYLKFNFWYDAGTSLASRTNSLPSQTGTFDLSHVSLVEGDATTEIEPFSPRHIGQELNLCQRFYESSYNLAVVPGTISTVSQVTSRVATLASAALHQMAIPCPFRTRKRATPTMVFYSPQTGVSAMASAYVAPITDMACTGSGTGENTSLAVVTDTRTGTEAYFGVHWTASAEL